MAARIILIKSFRCVTRGGRGWWAHTHTHTHVRIFLYNSRGIVCGHLDGHEDHFDQEFQVCDKGARGGGEGTRTGACFYTQGLIFLFLQENSRSIADDHLGIFHQE